MSFIHKHARLLLVAASCAALGAGASAIATAGAATNHKAHGAQGHTAKLRSGRRLAARAVHGDLIVPTKTGFAAVTFDRGTVKSVSGQPLTLTHGTKRVTYKTVTLTIPTTARIRDNRKKATLADVKTGQRATVVKTPKATFVIARTPR